AQRAAGGGHHPVRAGPAAAPAAVDADRSTRPAAAGRGPLLARLRGALLAVGLALVAAAAAVLLYQHNTGWMYDAKVYRTGGAAALHGLDVYRRLPPAIWLCLPA